MATKKINKKAADKKVVSNKLLNGSLKDIVESFFFSDMDAEYSLYDHFTDHWSSFKGKDLPSRSDILQLLLSNSSWQRRFKELTENVVDDLMSTFNRVKEEQKENERADAEAAKMLAEEARAAAERKDQQKKLRSLFSKEQLAFLKEAFDISA